MRWLRLLALAAIACAATPAVGSPPSARATAAATAPQPATATAPASASARSSACPEAMHLIDGDYCSDVEQKCLRSWFDESNKKTVCEEFEPKSVCTGTKSHKRFCIDEYS